jgi:hypothetical protein
VSAPRIGCNTFIWRSPFSTETDLDVIDHVADLGGEVAAPRPLGRSPIAAAG